jgi:hypothetical protein
MKYNVISERICNEKLSYSSETMALPYLKFNIEEVEKKSSTKKRGRKRKGSLCEETIFDYHGFSGSCIYGKDNNIKGMIVSYKPFDGNAILAIPYDILMFFVNKIINKSKIYLLPEITVEMTEYNGSKCFKLRKPFDILEENYILYKLNDIRLNEQYKIPVSVSSDTTYEVDIDTYILLKNCEKVKFTYISNKSDEEQDIVIQMPMYDSQVIHKKCIFYKGNLFSLLPISLYSVYHLTDLAKTYIEVLGKQRIFCFDKLEEFELTKQLEQLNRTIKLNKTNVEITIINKNGVMEKSNFNLLLTC